MHPNISFSSINELKIENVLLQCSFILRIIGRIIVILNLIYLKFIIGLLYCANCGFCRHSRKTFWILSLPFVCEHAVVWVLGIVVPGVLRWRSGLSAASAERPTPGANIWSATGRRIQTNVLTDVPLVSRPSKGRSTWPDIC